MTLDFYFDYISPFAYLAWLRITELADRRALELNPIPVVFGAILDHWGQLGPAEIPPKREYTFKTLARYCAKHHIPAKGPKAHPFVPLAALRASLPEIATARRRAVVSALFDAIWGEGIDGASADELAAALARRGFDGAAMLARTQEPAIKEALKANTAAAVARGVFGVPTIFAGGELFWGNDSLEWLEHYLDGEDPLEKSAISDMLARPRGQDRKKVQGVSLT